MTDWYKKELDRLREAYLKKGGGPQIPVGPPMIMMEIPKVASVMGICPECHAARELSWKQLCYWSAKWQCPVCKNLFEVRDEIAIVNNSSDNS